MRKIEREEEAAYVGPGSHIGVVSFGKTVHHKMHFGAPYEFKPNKNPAPGSYNANVNLVRPKKSVSAFSKSDKGNRLGKGSFLDSGSKDHPSGGNYQNYTKESFVGKTNKVTI